MAERSITTIVGEKAKYYVLDCISSQQTTVVKKSEFSFPGSFGTVEAFLPNQIGAIRKASPIKLELDSDYKGNIEPLGVPYMAFYGPGEWAG